MKHDEKKELPEFRHFLFYLSGLRLDSYIFEFKKRGIFNFILVEEREEY